MKRILKARQLVCLLTALLLLGTLLFPARAAGDARSAIIDGINRGQTSIDLTEYRLTPEQLQELFAEVLYSGQIPWYVDSQYTYYYVEETGLVTSLEIQLLSSEQYDRQLYDRTAGEILAQIIHPGMQQWQIALAIHDYLATHCTYDDTLSGGTAYDALVLGTAVCQGYAQAYMDLLNRCGVECIMVDSLEMDHSWNQVKLDGQWYHVDVLWDDADGNTHGYVEHTYFLLTDNEAVMLGYSNWGSDSIYSGSSYAGCWDNVEGSICFADALTGYRRIRGEDSYHIQKIDTASGEITELYTLPFQYLDIGEGRYHYYSYDLNFYNGMLYFSDMTNVYALAPGSAEPETVFTHDARTTGQYILSAFVEDHTLFLTLSDITGATANSEVPLTTPLPETHSHTYTSQITPPTCEEPGFTAYSCQCGLIYTSDITPALGHHYDNGQVTKKATQFAQGEQLFTCQTCGVTRTQVLEQLPGGTAMIVGIIVFLTVSLTVTAVALLRSRRKRSLSEESKITQ